MATCLIILNFLLKLVIDKWIYLLRTANKCWKCTTITGVLNGSLWDQLWRREVIRHPVYSLDLGHSDLLSNMKKWLAIKKFQLDKDVITVTNLNIQKGLKNKATLEKVFKCNKRLRCKIKIILSRKMRKFSFLQGIYKPPVFIGFLLSVNWIFPSNIVYSPTSQKIIG